MNQTVSLYRRRLPDFLIPFSSSRGKTIFKEALDEGNMESYFELGEQYITQARPEDCGLSTLVMILNSLGIDPGRTWHYPWRWYTEELLSCSQRDNNGISLPDFLKLALCNRTWSMGFYPTAQQALGLQSSHSCEIHQENAQFRFSSLETFRNAVIGTSRRSGFYIAVNSSRKVLGQTGDGHFSPLGGYHSASDLCLIMDVARFKYPAYWCPVPLLYQALEQKDPITNNTRGFVLLSRAKKHFAEICVSHMDITSLKNLPKPVSKDLLLNPTKDFLVILLHYFFDISEDMTTDMINKLDTQLVNTKESPLHAELLTLVKDMSPGFLQSSKLLSLAFENSSYEEPLNSYINKLRNVLGINLNNKIKSM